MNSAEIFLELVRTIDAAELAACSYALSLEVMTASKERAKLEQDAARIGLSKETTRDVLDSYERRARALNMLREAMMRPTASVL